jgi:DNA-binding LytR/AlgR family response regulator
MQTHLKQPDFYSVEKTNERRDFFPQTEVHNVHGRLIGKNAPAGKSSFMVFERNKYFTVPTESIAFFYVKHECSTIVCFNKQEHFVNYSLDQIQNLINDKHFFRVNRQYIISFSAVKEAEHYFARKLLVNLIVPAPEKLLVSREKASSFLEWLENR